MFSDSVARHDRCGTLEPYPRHPTRIWLYKINNGIPLDCDTAAVKDREVGVGVWEEGEVWRS